MDIGKWSRLVAACCLCLLLPPTVSLSQDIGENVLQNNYDSLAELLPDESKPETDKRSRSFFPLRGKKVLDPIFQLISEQEDKRSQFYPLRGKKIPEDLKRVSYFMPMRGRKDDMSWLEEEDPEKRASSFVPMRGKKRQLLQKTGMYSNNGISNISSHINNIRSYSYNPKMKTHVLVLPLPPADRKSKIQSPDDTKDRNFKTSGSKLHDNGRDYNVVERAENGHVDIESVGLVRKRRYLRHEIVSKTTENEKLGKENVELVRNRRWSGFFASRGKRLREEDKSDKIFGSRNPSDATRPWSKRKFAFYPMRGRRNGYRIQQNSLLKNHNNRSTFMSNFTKESTTNHQFIESGESDASDLKDVDDSENRPIFRSSYLPFPKQAKRNLLFLSEEQSNKAVLSPISGLSDSEFQKNSKVSGDEYMPKRFYKSASNKSLKTWHDEYVKRGRINFPNGFLLHNLFLSPGLGSSLLVHPARGRSPVPRRGWKYDWDSVKRAFHASRGKRVFDGHLEDKILRNSSFWKPSNSRFKRNIPRSRAFEKYYRHYLALKRPMSFFATRGKRGSTGEPSSALTQE